MSLTKKAEVMAASPSERYRVLLEIGRALVSTLDDDELYAAIHRETMRVMEADGFYISLYEPETDEATVVYWADGDRKSRAHATYVGSESEVIRTGSPVLIEDGLGEASLLVLGEHDGAPTRSAISAPLRIQDRTVGVISAQSYRAKAYSRSDLELLQGIADLAAVAAQNATHVSELHRRRREAERMEEIVRALVGSLNLEEVLSRVSDASLELLGGDGAVVWLVEEETARVAASRGATAPEVGTRVPLDAELIRILIDERRPLVVNDASSNALLRELFRNQRGTVSALIVPLTSGHRATGVLSVAGSHGRSFGENDARLLERLAGHATAAIQNAHLHESLQSLSLTDPLTKLPNRRHLELHLGRELAAAERGRWLSIVLFDLDNFKRYNDSFGHLAGDEVLEAMGEVLATETRAMNLVARYGGDEFLAVLSDTSLEGARQHAKRVENHVARHPDLGPHGISVSAGVAEYREGQDTVKSLIRAADEDLYRSKSVRERG